MDYLVKVNNKEFVVKPHLVKTIFDDIIVFDYIYSFDEENHKYNIIKNVKGLFIKFILGSQRNEVTTVVSDKNLSSKNLPASFIGFP